MVNAICVDGLKDGPLAAKFQAAPLLFLQKSGLRKKKKKNTTQVLLILVEMGNK